MEIVYKNVEELKEYENNPRDNKEAVSKVAESIELFGFVNPIAITRDNTIISGHTRLMAAKQLGMDKVPCIIHDISDDDARMVRIIDNKSNEFATWDVFKLQAEINAMPGVDTQFFKSNFRDVKTRLEDLVLSFGNIRVPVTESEYQRFKAVFDEYIKKESTYLGFIGYLMEGNNVQDREYSDNSSEGV